MNKPETMPFKKIFTLVFTKRNNSVLLGWKTRGLGQGLWNGFGGKLEPEESVIDCAKRELQEECNLVASNLRHIGLVRYELLHRNSADIVHIFTCHKFEGIEKPSEEMNPIQWFDFKAIPFKQMWPDSPHWYPHVLAENYFSAHVIYKDNETIIHSTVKSFENLSDALKLSAL